MARPGVVRAILARAPILARTLRARRVTGVALAAVGATVCGGDAQQAPSGMVLSSDPELATLAERLLPDLARRAGMTLERPVRIERRSREELVRFLRRKLEEDLPPERARAIVTSYALLGLVPPSLDLSALLLGLYTEQVAGFYEPDSTTLFLMDDQPPDGLQGLLVHELVHAVQDQSFDLAALTDPAVGSDRATAAQAAIEGHATLVMLEFLTEELGGGPVDLATLPDFSTALRPALEALGTRFPALAGAPAVIRESLLFPYLEGAGFVQRLWIEEGRVPPFGAFLPVSTEQVSEGDLSDEPVSLDLSIAGARVVHEDALGSLELGVFLDTHMGQGGAELAEGWGGDRYALVDTGSGPGGLVLAVVWDGTAARDRFVERLGPRLDRLEAGSAIESIVVDGRPGTLLRVGSARGLAVTVAERGGGGG